MHSMKQKRIKEELVKALEVSQTTGISMSLVRSMLIEYHNLWEDLIYIDEVSVGMMADEYYGGGDPYNVRRISDVKVRKRFDVLHGRLFPQPTALEFTIGVEVAEGVAHLLGTPISHSIVNGDLSNEAPF